MAAHVLPEELDRYASQKLEPSELMALSRHLDECADCRERSTNLQLARGGTFADAVKGDAPEHLDYEAIERFIDGTCDPTECERIEQHSAGCASCAAEIDDLRQFSRGFSSALPHRQDRWWGWAMAAMVVLAVGGAITTFHRLEPAPSARVPSDTVTIRDANGIVSLDSRGRVHGAPAGWEETVRQAMSASRLPEPEFARAFINRTDILRGETENPPLRIVYPSQTAVLDDRPRFEWTAEGAGSTFNVEVFDAQFRQVARSDSLTEPRWRPQRPLPRNVKLQWQVIETLDSQRFNAPRPPDVPAEFIIVDAESAARIEAARSTGSHLVLATLYARAGLRAEAKNELEALSRLNPKSVVVARLLSGLQLSGGVR